MQIVLKQPEINAAIRQYISQQGINLTNKTVTIAFTAGRKEAGISADISIDDQDLPDLGPDDSGVKPVLNLVPTAEVKQTPAPEPEGEPTAEEAPAKATSLFS